MPRWCRETRRDTLRVEDLSSGKPVDGGHGDRSARRLGLCRREFPRLARCASSSSISRARRALTVRPVEEPAPGKFQFGAGQSFDLGQPVRRVVALDENGGEEAVRHIRRGREGRGVRFRRNARRPRWSRAWRRPTSLFTCAASTAGRLHCFLTARRRQVLDALPDLQGRAAGPTPPARSAAWLPWRTTTTSPSRTSTRGSSPNRPRRPRAR